MLVHVSSVEGMPQNLRFRKIQTCPLELDLIQLELLFFIGHFEL